MGGDYQSEFWQYQDEMSAKMEAVSADVDEAAAHREKFVEDLVAGKAQPADPDAAPHHVWQAFFSLLMQSELEGWDQWSRSDLMYLLHGVRSSTGGFLDVDEVVGVTPAWRVQLAWMAAMVEPAHRNWSPANYASAAQGWDADYAAAKVTVSWYELLVALGYVPTTWEIAQLHTVAADWATSLAAVGEVA